MEGKAFRQPPHRRLWCSEVHSGGRLPSHPVFVHPTMEKSTVPSVTPKQRPVRVQSLSHTKAQPFGATGGCWAVSVPVQAAHCWPLCAAVPGLPTGACVWSPHGCQLHSSLGHMVEEKERASAPGKHKPLRKSERTSLFPWNYTVWGLGQSRRFFKMTSELPEL